MRHGPTVGAAVMVCALGPAVALNGMLPRQQAHERANARNLHHDLPNGSTADGWLETPHFSPRRSRPPGAAAHFPHLRGVGNRLAPAILHPGETWTDATLNNPGTVEVSNAGPGIVDASGGGGTAFVRA